MNEPAHLAGLFDPTNKLSLFLPELPPDMARDYLNGRAGELHLGQCCGEERRPGEVHIVGHPRLLGFPGRGMRSGGKVGGICHTWSSD
jgi:hypothetical protein